jgi:hypothetical protein
MRTGAATTFSIIGNVPFGTTCTVLSGPTVNAYTWYRVSCPTPGTGWVAGEYFAQVSASAASAGESDSVEAPPTNTSVPVATAVPTNTPEPTVEPVEVEEEAATEPPATLEEQPAGPQPYPIARVQRTDGSEHGRVLVDDDPATIWQTTGDAVPQIASFALDLDGSVPISNVRWLPAPAGIAGRLLVHISTDGENWTEMNLEAVVVEEQWNVLPIDAEARFVRFAFINEEGSPWLGGVAEVEVWP